MVNETRLRAAKLIFFGPLVCITLVGIFFGLSLIPWSLINWKFGVGMAVCLWLTLVGILYWDGSREKENEGYY